MENIITKHTDGINLYSTFQVKSKLIGKIVLSVAIVLLVTLLSLLISTIEKDQIASSIFPFVIFFCLIIVFPVRYLLWNLYGKENLIVNTKSVSFNHDYGVFKTNLKTIPFYRLGIGFEILKEEDEIEKGKIVFYNFREKDDLPEIIHQTSVIIDIIEFKIIEIDIHNLFSKQYEESKLFNEFSVN